MTGRRFNPRQRWHEDDDHGLGWAARGSTVAGVPMDVMTDLARLSIENERRPNAEKSYADRIIRIAEAVLAGLETLAAGASEARVDAGLAEMRLIQGRRGPGEVEVTIVSSDYSEMRQFLTSASLGWHARQGALERGTDDHVEPSPRMRILNLTLQTLERSSDRRPFNQYSYRDIPLGDIGALGHKRRREAVEDDRRFRLCMDDLFGRSSCPIGTPDAVVAQRLTEAA